MGLLKPTFAIIQDTRKANIEGKYPLKLRVIFNRQNRTYSIGIDLSKEQFEKLFSSKLRDEWLKDVRLNCEAIKQKAEEVGSKIDEFTFDKFKDTFFVNPEEQVKSKDVYKNFENYISALKSQSRVSTADSYTCASNSLKKFKKKLTFEDITPKFLNDYEKSMLNEGNSSTTIGIYLRSLRTIYNQAIENGIIAKELYPFKKNKFQIPASRNIKKAFTISEIEKIFNYETITGTSEDKAKDLWCLSYLCQGINLKDLARLKIKNLESDKITFIRAKTQLSTKANQSAITIILSDKAKEIIDKWKNRSNNPDDYLLPILEPKVTPKREKELIQYTNKLINTYMKRIGLKLGFEKMPLFYSARHSFATVLKRSGVSTEFISEALGHSNLATTQSYLDSFEDETKKQYANLLTKFN
ncbi:integrase [Emticicia aquatilis]|uniref:Integrase n=1 Tax=Emticicia aquatilis TaxID=1537369 RepID=A0A917DTE2_9BACT|nr:site-specific integrase [Emticicia aquatilis]GGD68591.1 integrase [Emticicia aquatilis]